MNYFLKKKKWLAWVIMLTFLFTSFMPSNIMAGNSVAEAAGGSQSQGQLTVEDQIVSGKKENSIKYISVEDDGTNGDVQISKTVEAGDNENEFTIHLDVKTTESLEKIPTTADAAVVLVIDHSGSMNTCTLTEHKHSWECNKLCGKDEHTHGPWCYGWNGQLKCDYTEEHVHTADCYSCGKIEHDHDYSRSCVSRMSAAQTAAKNFTEMFAKSAILKDENGNPVDMTGLPPSKRMVSVIGFSSNASRKAEWQNVARAQEDTPVNAENTINAAINSLSTGGGTNIEGALQLAYNQIIDPTTNQVNSELKGINNVTVILLTDGCPTYHVGEKADRDGVESINGTYGGGTFATYKDHSQAATMAGKIKSTSVNGALISLQCIAFATGTAKFVDEKGESYRQDVQNWMGAELGTVHSATNLTELLGSFTEILKTIKLGAEAWYVTDLMNDANKPKYIKWNSVNKSDSKNPENLKEHPNTFTYLPSTDTLTWNLKESAYKTKEEDGKTWYYYHLDYPILLDNTVGDKETVVEKVATNGTTELKYYLFTKEQQKPIPDKPYTAKFTVPAVKGYYGDVTFTKQDVEKDKNGDPILLEGAQFCLKLDDNHGSKYHHGDYATGKIVTTGKDGVIKFEDIPSGHTYKLYETEAPEGYEQITETDKTAGDGIGKLIGTYYVDFGTVKKGSSKTEATAFSTDGKDKIITNQKVVKDITFDKVDSANKPLAGAKFKLYKPNTDLAATTVLGELVGTAESKTVGDKAVVTFEEIPYGTYYIQEYDFDSTTPEGVVKIGNIVYTVNPTIYKVVVGATVTITKLDDALGTPITSITNNEAMTTVEGTKTWENVDSDKLPESITVALYNGEEQVGYAKTITADDYWKYSFTAPKYDKDGKEIAYTVKETKIGNVNVTNKTDNDVTTGTTKTTTNAADGYYLVTYNDNNITNKFVKDVTATKTWIDGDDDNRPAITVQLLQDGTAYTMVNPTTSISDNVTTYTWVGVPVNDEDGEPITYTVKETNVGDATVGDDGYVTADGKTYYVTYSHDRLAITNTLMTSVTVEKQWKNDNDNQWPANAIVTVGLYQGGVLQGTAALTSETQSHTFDKLQKYDAAGQVITYTAQEVTVDNNGNVTPITTAIFGDDTYHVTVGAIDDGKITITNTITGDADIKVEKDWKDNNNQDGLRKDITVQLQKKEGDQWVKVENLPKYEEQDQSATQTLATGGKHEDALTYTWHDVPLYDDGKPIYYRVVETKIGNEQVTNNETDGYAVTYSDNNTNGIGPNATNRVVKITNSHEPQTVKLQVEKTWAGDRDQQTKLDLTHNRKDLEFKIEATVEGKDVEELEKTIAMQASSNSDVQTEVVELPKYHNGKPITYTITETSVPAGYTVSYNDSKTYTTGQSNAVMAFFSGLFTTEESEKPDHTFKVTNTLKTGNFSFTKEYSGSEPANKAGFTLTAVNPTDTGIQVDTKTANQNTYTFNDLKYGVVYKVEETTVPKGYEKAPVFYLKLEKNTDGEYVVKAYKDEICSIAVIAVTDIIKDTGLYLAGTAYKLKNFVKTADFSFTKAFDSKKPGTMPTFTIKKIADAEGNIISSSVEKTVNVNDTDTYLFKDLECGTYTVKESSVPGYESVEFRIEVKEDSSGKAVVSVVKEDGKIYPIGNTTDGYTLTNIAKTTNLTLLKTYNGIYTGDASFRIEEIGADLPDVAVVTGENGIYTFANLQYGKQYKVTEIAPTGYQAVEPFTITVVVENGEVVAKITDTVEGLEIGTQATGADYVLENKVKTIGFQFNKVFEDNRNTTTPSFVAYQLTKDGQGTAQFKFDYSNVDGTHQYSLADGLEYGRTYAVVESDVPAGYEQAKPFYITIGVDDSSKKNACVTEAKGISTNGAGLYELTNVLKEAKYEIHYHYQQVADKIDVYVEEGEPRIVDAKVGDPLDVNKILTADDKDYEKHVTTSSMYVFNADKTASENADKVVVENVDGDITVLNVYFDLRFAVQYHWKDADGVVHNDATNANPIFDLTLDDVVAHSGNQSPDAEAQPDDPWYLFNGQWYATTQSAIGYDWNFDNSKQWLRDSEQLNQQNILNYVEGNILHLYAAWSAKPAAKGNIQVSKTVQVVNEKEGNTDRDKLFEFALDLYVTTGSGLTFEEAKASATSPSALNFNVFFSDKDGLAFAQPEATLTDDKNGHYLYEFFLRDGDTVDFDVKAVTTSGSAYVYFQVREVGAGENAPFDTERTIW